jgi:hypothetical protein
MDSLYKGINTVDDFRIGRLGWACDIIRTEEERISKKVLNEKFHNSQSVRKPRTRGAEIVQRDALQILGIRGWKRQAGNREEWRLLLREVRAQKGF